MLTILFIYYPYYFNFYYFCTYLSIYDCYKPFIKLELYLLSAVLANNFRLITWNNWQKSLFVDSLYKLNAETVDITYLNLTTHSSEINLFYNLSKCPLMILLMMSCLREVSNTYFYSTLQSMNRQSLKLVYCFWKSIYMKRIIQISNP